MAAENWEDLLDEMDSSIGATGENPDLALGLESEEEGDGSEEADSLLDAVRDALDDLEAVARDLAAAADEDPDMSKIDALLGDEEPRGEEPPAEGPPAEASEEPGHGEEEHPEEPQDVEHDDLREPEDEDDYGTDGEDDFRDDGYQDEEPRGEEPPAEEPGHGEEGGHGDELADVEMAIEMKKRELAELEAYCRKLKGEGGSEDEDYMSEEDYEDDYRDKEEKDKDKESEEDECMEDDSQIGPGQVYQSKNKLWYAKSKSGKSTIGPFKDRAEAERHLAASK